MPKMVRKQSTPGNIFLDCFEGDVYVSGSSSPMVIESPDRLIEIITCIFPEFDETFEYEDVYNNFIEFMEQILGEDRELKIGSGKWKK